MNTPPHKIMYFLNPDVGGDDFLGKGAFGYVFKGYRYDDNKIDKKGEQVAIKKINTTNKPLDMYKGLGKIISNEIKLFRTFHQKIKTHPNLITIHDIFQTKNNLYIVMKLCGKKCSLLDYIRTFRKKKKDIPEDEIISIISDIL